MYPTLEYLWDDENFAVQVGVIPGLATLSGTELGPAMIYYQGHVQATPRLRALGEAAAVPHSHSSGLRFFWNTGVQTEFFNSHDCSTRIIRVALKPPPQLAAMLPKESGDLAYSILLDNHWHENFKASVRDDFDAIREFVEPLRSSQLPDKESSDRALLAKQDLDLKLLWSTREQMRLGVFGLGYRTGPLATVAAGTATGFINVTVNTKDAANVAVSGCVIWYVTRITHNRPGSYLSFSKFSTPTSEPMGVGNYQMWAEKGGASGAKHIVSIISASAAQSVDLAAP